MIHTSAKPEQANPPFVAPCDPQTLLNHRIIGATDDVWDWRSWSNWLGAQWPSNPNIIGVKTDDMAIQAALSGAGIALAEMRLVANELATGALIPACSCGPMEIGYYTVETAGSQPPDLTSAVISWLRSISADAYALSYQTCAPMIQDGTNTSSSALVP